MINARFKFVTETKGAFRYAEVDEAGEVIEMVNGKIGTLYLRKTALNGTRPEFLEVAIKPVVMA
jgi:hypothetical protein